MSELFDPASGEPLDRSAGRDGDPIDPFTAGPAPERHEDDRLSAFLDDELEEEEALAVTRHLAGCDRCLAELDALRTLRHTLRALPPVEPPADLYGEVATKLGRVRGRSRRTVRLAAAALTSAAVLGAAALLDTEEEPGTVSPPVDVYVVDHIARAGRGPLPVPVDVGR